MYVYTCSITDSKCITKLAGLWSAHSLHHGLHVYLKTCSIRASECISKLAQLRSPYSLTHGFQVYLQTLSITASKLAPSPPSSTPQSTYDHDLELYLQTCSITILEWISKFPRLRFGEMLEEEGRQSIMNTPLRLAWYPMVFAEDQRYQLEELRMRVK